MPIDYNFSNWNKENEKNYQTEQYRSKTLTPLGVLKSNNNDNLSLTVNTPLSKNSEHLEDKFANMASSSFIPNSTRSIQQTLSGLHTKISNSKMQDCRRAQVRPAL